MGITVSRKVGGAVVRNRVKRWIRECYRRQRTDFPARWTSSSWRVRRRPGGARRHLPRALGAGAPAGHQVNLVMSWVSADAGSPLPRGAVADACARCSGRAAGSSRAAPPTRRRRSARTARCAACWLAVRRLAALPSVRARGLRSGAGAAAAGGAAEDGRGAGGLVHGQASPHRDRPCAWACSSCGRSCFSTAPPKPPAAAPVAGQTRPRRRPTRRRRRGAPGTPGGARGCRGAPGTAAAPVDESARAAGRAVDARGALRVLQPGRDAGARAAAREAVPRRPEESGDRPRRRARQRRRQMPRCASRSRLRLPTPADGAWEVSQPTPDTVVFAADVGTVHIEKRYRLGQGPLSAAAGRRASPTAATRRSVSKLAVSVERPPRTPTSAAAASSRACRPTSRRRSASSTAASSASRSRAWRKSPIADKGGTVAVDRDGREVLPARRGSLSRGAGPSAARAGRCRPARTSAR